MTKQELCRLQDYEHIKHTETGQIAVINHKFNDYADDGCEMTAKGAGFYYTYDGGHLCTACGCIPMDEAEQWERYGNGR